jgi:murein DD-endopeptidase MepM/ murein hydrolase activator NlpD
MAAGTVGYEAPQYGNLAGAIGGKIGSALTMAAQSRRKRDEEKGVLSKQIAELDKKEDKTDEEKQQLKDLQKRKEDLDSQEFGFIAKKALGAEFGGDLKRRTKGFFQMDPADQNDPALDKKKRFEALLRAESVGKQTPPGETPQSPKAVQDGGILGSLATDIIQKISLLEKKISDLKSVEEKDQTPKTVVNLSKNVGSIRKFFSKNNKIEEKQLKISQEQLEQQKEEADDAKQARAEALAEARDPGAGTAGIDNRREGSTLKKLFGGLLDFGLDRLGFGGRRGRRGRRRGGRRRGGFNLGMFSRRGRRRGASRNLSRGRTQYTAPIGPQPMNSPTPWARRGAGDRGGMHGQGEFTPRMESSPTKFASGGVIKHSKPTPREKFAAGGIVDNPTTGQAIIPQNKLTSAVQGNQENAKKADPFAKVLQLPTMAAGGLLMSVVGNVINNMGGIAKLFRPVLSRLFVPAAAAFGLPANLITAFFGAPAQASMMVGSPGTGKGNGKTGTGNAVNAATGGNATGISAGGMVTGGGSVGQYRASRGYGMQRHPIYGTQKMHWGIDYAIPEGEPIGLKKGGKVVEVAPPTRGGEVSGIVRVQHEDGTESRYVHLSEVSVSNGETVYPGTLVGKVGGVPGNPGGGGSTGAHLHWEYYTSAGNPADGAGLADSYFTVGGQITTPTTPPAAPASPTATPQTPSAPPSAPAGPTTLPPIVLPAPGTQDRRSAAAQARRASASGANLPVRNPNGEPSLSGANA